MPSFLYKNDRIIKKFFLLYEAITCYSAMILSKRLILKSNSCMVCSTVSSSSLFDVRMMFIPDDTLSEIDE